MNELGSYFDLIPPELINEIVDYLPYYQWKDIYNGYYGEYFQTIAYITENAREKEGNRKWNGKKDGHWMFIIDGICIIDEYWKEGVKHGKFQTWHNYDQLATEIDYLDGTLHGISRSWYENGQNREYCEWEFGKKDGIEKVWRKNGQLHYQIHWRNGKKHGPEKTWYENGVIYEYVNWYNGKREGVSRTWYNTGLLTAEVKWKNGVCISSRLWDVYGKQIIEERALTKDTNTSFHNFASPYLSH